MSFRYECCGLSEVSASRRSLVQRTPTDCGMSECDPEDSNMEAVTRKRVEAPNEIKCFNTFHLSCNNQIHNI